MNIAKYSIILIALSNLTNSYGSEKPQAIPLSSLALTFQNEGQQPDPLGAREISVHTFSYISSDELALETLRACSQVCISWYHACQNHGLVPYLKNRYYGHMHQGFFALFPENLSPFQLIKEFFFYQQKEEALLTWVKSQIILPTPCAQSYFTMERIELDNTETDWKELKSFLKPTLPFNKNDDSCAYHLIFSTFVSPKIDWSLMSMALQGRKQQNQKSIRFNSCENILHVLNSGLLIRSLKYTLLNQNLEGDYNIQWVDPMTRFPLETIYKVRKILATKKLLKAEILKIKLTLNSRHTLWTVKWPISSSIEEDLIIECKRQLEVQPIIYLDSEDVDSEESDEDTVSNPVS